MPEQNKPGKKTSEFWMTIVGTILALLSPIVSQKWGFEMPKEVILSIVGAIAAYTVSRGVSKITIPTEKQKEDYNSATSGTSGTMGT